MILAEAAPIVGGWPGSGRGARQTPSARSRSSAVVRRLDTTRAQIVHEVAHVEQRPNVGRRVPLAAMAENVAVRLFDDFGGERQVAGDDEVAGVHAFDDLVVGHVEAGGNLHATDMARVARRASGWRSASAEVSVRFAARKRISFDYLGAGVGINPDIHQINPSAPSSSFSQA